MFFYEPHKRGPVIFCRYFVAACFFTSVAPEPKFQLKKECWNIPAPLTVEAWLTKAGDPDVFVTHWRQSGAPLCANLSIDVCKIFPKKEDEDTPIEQSIAQVYAEVTDYESFVGDQTDSDIEVDRLIEEKGFVTRISVKDAERCFQRPIMSKLGLIVKEHSEG